MLDLSVFEGVGLAVVFPDFEGLEAGDTWLTYLPFLSWFSIYLCASIWASKFELLLFISEILFFFECAFSNLFALLVFEFDLSSDRGESI